MDCKFGEVLGNLNTADRETIEGHIRQGMAPIHVAARVKESGHSVSHEMIRRHIGALCRCTRLEQAAAPGPTDAGTAKRAKVSIPRGWEPRLELNDDGGTLVTSPAEPIDGEPDDADLLAEFDMDPDTWAVKSVNRSRWQAANGEWRESFKAAFQRRASGPRVDIDDLLDLVRPYVGVEPAERPAATGGAYVVPAGDLQLGKPDGDGSAGTIERFCSKVLAARDRLLAMRSRGEELGAVVLPWLGDCIEGVVSQGGRNIATLDLTPSEQLRVYRRLMLFQVETFAPIAGELIIPVVPGNHDEATRVQNLGGTDSWAIEGAAAVADSLKLAPESFGHVRFVFPQPGELTVTLDVAGTRMGFLHGHQITGRDGAEKWLSGQALGRQPIGDADILLTAHLHHFRCQEVGAGQTIIQTPALDGGSDWFRTRYGGSAPDGMLSLVVEGGTWRELSRH